MTAAVKLQKVVLRAVLHNNEQKAPQPIHEKYLKGRKFFNAVSKVMTNSDVINWSEDQQINGGIEIIAYNSRIKYWCKLLGYGVNEGCKP